MSAIKPARRTTPRLILPIHPKETRMARIATRPPEPPSHARSTTPVATWAGWFANLQALQVHAARDVLTVCNRYVAALAASHDPQAVAAAFQAALGDWVACVDRVQHECLALSRAVPADALAAVGWRLKPGARRVEDEPHGGAPNFFEQSRLGAELLLRPWLPAPDLDHTDEFVA
ncbi:MAG: hypothetical protein ACJ8IK_18480 [Burkholderiaceae bacterium]